jgi:hypothetical protein
MKERLVLHQIGHNSLFLFFEERASAKNPRFPPDEVLGQNFS